MKNRKDKNQSETAGKLMVEKIPIVDENSTVGDVEKMLIEKAKNFITIDYIYATDKRGKLKGVFSVRELFHSDKKIFIKKLFPQKIVSVRSNTDQERLALLAIRNNLKAIPVIDKKGNLLGAVPSDIIMKVLQDEHVEDLLRFAGVGKIKNPSIALANASVFFHFRKRLPWLVIGLGGGVLAAFVVEYFKLAIEAHLVLAAFIPVIVYMADAAAGQTQAVFIRAMATERNLELKKYIGREVGINILLSIFLSVLIFAISYLWINIFEVSLVLGLSIFFTVFCAIIISLLLPIVLGKMKFDPAIASGPFATVITDILSLMIYFTVATLVIS